MDTPPPESGVYITWETTRVLENSFKSRLKYSLKLPSCVPMIISLMIEDLLQLYPLRLPLLPQPFNRYDFDYLNNSSSPIAHGSACIDSFSNGNYSNGS